MVERHFAADAERGPELVRTLGPNVVILMLGTNDAASVDEDGYVYLADRRTD